MSADAFVWCLAIGAVLGVLVLIGNRKQGYQLTCPHCKSTMNVGAEVCRKCGRNVPRKERKRVNGLGER